MRFLNRAKLLIILTLLSAPSFAQEDVDQLLEENVGDARKLVSAYISPFMKSVSLGLNQGWYNTAKTHKVAGVDLTITVNAMTIPNSELFYNVGSLNLETVELDPSSPDFTTDRAPSIFGPEREPVFRINDPESSNFGDTFDGPAGLDLKENIGSNKVPVPMAHLGFGLPKGTDIKLRFTPALNFGDDSELKIFGIGVMHDIKQWIPGIKLMPFDLSGFFGYTRLKLESKFDEDPQGGAQTGVFEMNATTIQVLISKKFSVITFYGGLGYNIAKSNIAMKGWYDIDEDGVKEPNNFEVNPIDLKFAASGARATAGMRLKLAVFTFHADYTLQKYKCLSVGFGIAVR
jgi:hypothetical protein